MPVPSKRDYSLIGLDSRLAQENGLAAADWYACSIPRKELKALMKRKDGPAIRDPEIAAPRPPDVVAILLNLFALKNGYIAFRHLFLHAAGRLTAEEETFVPEMERWKVYVIARIYLAIFAAVIAVCLAFKTIMPAMYIGLPTFYGGFMTIYFGLTQPAGPAEDVLDHRLNRRTVYMNPTFRL